jgi:hypothetical protein
LLLCRTVDQSQQLTKPIGKNQSIQYFCLKGRIAPEVFAAELPDEAKRLFKVEAVPGGRVGKTRVFFTKNEPNEFFVFFLWFFIFIFAQKREFLGFFQFQEYF